MKRILSPKHSLFLARVMKQKPLLIFDYDGTLSPIVKTPDKARMRTSTERLMRDLAKRFPCAIVSGRARDDLKRRIRTIPFMAIVGNHGLETGSRVSHAAKARRQIREWADQIKREIPLDSIFLEDKKYTLSVHYKQASDKKPILKVLSRLRATHIIPGKQVYNVLPDWAPHKGDAVRRLVKMAKRNMALYVGDDDTDEYAFALRRELPLITIRVGAWRASHAEFYLEAQSEIDALIRMILT